MTPIPATNLYQKSNVLNYLRNNFGTFSGDVQCIRKSLHEAECDVRRYDDEIRRMEARIVSLRNEQQAILFRVDQYRSLLAPIRKVPPEVLGNIFTLCCSVESKIAERIDSPPIRLSQVCAGWRELAMTTAPLWARLNIDLNRDMDQMPSGDKMKSMLDTHLTLSKNSPLTLSVTIPSRWDDLEQAQVVIDCIVPHSSRWQDVSLDISRELLMGPIFAAIKGNLSQLQSLFLWPPSKCSISFPTTVATLDVFTSAPMLRNIQIGSLTQTEPGIPWSQLSDMGLYWQNGTTMLHRIKLASAASTIGIYWCHDVPLPDLQGPLVHNMRSLTLIQNKYGSSFRQLYDAFILPRLTTLHLSGAESEIAKVNFPTAYLHLPHLLSLIRRSQCSLTSLTLRNLHSPDDDILALLDEIPTLLSLEIHELPTEGDFDNKAITKRLLLEMTFNHRNPRANRSLLLPCLKSLSFRVRPFDYASAFVRMVQSRWIPNPDYASAMGISGLKKVVLDVLGPKGEGLKSPMDLWRR
ncbi:hypothetical protein D9758_014181 [Tetrapyrgos nigripes]|uniref:F-box domain-containing protein n=1 Tax=Tetrapyrgos nigripes TaxID=182062 RepID=A0A8H5CMI3_9AGAR|nr:hypothetical protein D9758_014181 [Tetrapyrgos nigripes]